MGYNPIGPPPVPRGIPIPYANRTPAEKIEISKRLYVGSDIDLPELERRIGLALEEERRLSAPKRRELPDDERDTGRAVKVLVPKRPFPRASADMRPPEPIDYHEVWLTPHELRRCAERKLRGEEL